MIHSLKAHMHACVNLESLAECNRQKPARLITLSPVERSSREKNKRIASSVFSVAGAVGARLTQKRAFKFISAPQALSDNRICDERKRLSTTRRPHNYPAAPFNLVCKVEWDNRGGRKNIFKIISICMQIKVYVHMRHTSNSNFQSQYHDELDFYWFDFHIVWLAAQRGGGEGGYRSQPERYPNTETTTNK